MARPPFCCKCECVRGFFSPPRLLRLLAGCEIPSLRKISSSWPQAPGHRARLPVQALNCDTLAHKRYKMCAFVRVR